MNPTEVISKEELEKYYCFEDVDRVPRDNVTTNFKRRARYQQALWREKKEFPIGSQPIQIKEGIDSRPMGCRIELTYAQNGMVNFLTPTIKEAVIDRLNNPEPKQTLDSDRLYANCLSSMPMCFNLFGSLYGDMKKASEALKNWWPLSPGTVSHIRFEWSPGRQIFGRFLENRSAFDVAFELDLDSGAKGIIGIETKYHEHCKKEAVPSEKRLDRYRLISEKSGLFKPNSINAIIGSELQQIWQDHILALSMLQDERSNWDWVKFVLVYPAKNSSFAKAAAEYSNHLKNADTYEWRTVESLLSCPVINEEDLQRQIYLVDSCIMSFDLMLIWILGFVFITLCL